MKPASASDNEDGLVLFSPRFSITIKLPDAVKQELRSGQQAMIQIKGAARSPAAIVGNSIRSWFLSRHKPQPQ